MPNIRELIKKQKTFYQSIVSIFCPLLNETVHFTGDGFYHLLHKSSGKRRSVNEAYLKLMCLSKAHVIVKNATRSVETRKSERLVKGQQKTVVTYELVDSTKRNTHIAVVIEKIGTGKLKFRSVKRIGNKRYNNTQ